MATLALFIYQKPSWPTVMSLLKLTAPGASRYRWGLMPEARDALIDRARSIAATRWLTQHDDDVLVMSDDDFGFSASGLDSLADLANEHESIAAGVTPLKSGDYTAIVALNGSSAEPWRSPSSYPERVRWAGGLIAYHRSVFEALATTLPLLHKNDVIEPFYPFFMPMIYEHERDGLIYLSEDYACQERARAVGKSVYVQPACQVGHLARDLMITTANMDRVRGAYI